MASLQKIWHDRMRKTSAMSRYVGLKAEEVKSQARHVRVVNGKDRMGNSVTAVSTLTMADLLKQFGGGE